MTDGEKTSRVVRYDPLLPSAKIFASLKNGPRPKLDTTCEFGGATWRFRGPDILGIPEQTLLLALMEMAGAQLGASSTDEPSWHDLRTGLYNGLRWDGGLPATATIQTSYRELCRRCGLTGDGGSARDHIRKLLERLCEVTVWCCTGQGEQRCSRLLQWRYGNAEGVQVILNWRLTEALVGAQYSPVNLAERLALTTDAARALHCALSVRVRPGGSMQFHLEKLAPYIWHETAVAPATQRRRHQELRASLESLQGLGTWTVSSLTKQSGAGGQIVDIGRHTPKRPTAKTDRPRKSSATGQRPARTLQTIASAQKPTVTDISDLFK